GRRENPAFHHLVKGYESQQRVYAEVTCSTAVLTDPEHAAAEINRVLDDCLTQKRPGYIEIPVDMTGVEINVPSMAAQCSTGPAVDVAALEEAAAEIVGAFEQARRPVLYTGVGLRRHGLVGDARIVAEKWGLPVVSSVMGKSAFPESHGNYAGFYMGKMGDEKVRNLLENADLVLAVGVIFSDVNTGLGTGTIDTEKLIDMRDLDVKISHHVYDRVPVSRLLPHLAKLRPEPKSLPLIDSFRRITPAAGKEGSLTTAQLIRSLSAMDQHLFSFLADVGDGWFAGLELEADIFMAPGYYASMGFAVPGAIGAALAVTDRRPLVLVGDGAFQMTGNELSTLIANKLNPLVIVLNNRYYKMLAALDGHRAYYDLHNWDYVQYAAAMGCPGGRARTVTELEHLLTQALDADNGFLIETVLQKEDHAPIMQKINEFAQMGGKIR
ncbi:MAG: thiamine pyrophosphate-dependent enzyme, partial [Desulforhopalus sp.]